MSNCPKITVVTICFNAEKEAESTILSVINQTYKDVEYLIIDGGSTDNTLELIKKYDSHISKWISEKDNGIYDAMNKGIKLATGSWIIFMNVGDQFASNTVLDEVAPMLDDSDIVYGSAIFNYGFTTRLVKPTSLNNLECGNMCFCHQSVFTKTELMKETLFDSSFRVIADYKFFLDSYNRKKKFKEIPTVVSIYEKLAGISSIGTWKQFQLHREELRKIGKLNGHSASISRFILRKLIFLLLPTFILQIIYSRK